MLYRVIIGVWKTRRAYENYFFDDFKSALKFAMKQEICLFDVIIEDAYSGDILIRFQG